MSSFFIVLLFSVINSFYLSFIVFYFNIYSLIPKVCSLFLCVYLNLILFILLSVSTFTKVSYNCLCKLIVFKPSTEIKKQNAEKISEMSDIVAKSKRDFADEIEKERASSKQLRDALNNLQVILPNIFILFVASNMLE